MGGPGSGRKKGSGGGVKKTTKKKVRLNKDGTPRALPGKGKNYRERVYNGLALSPGSRMVD